MANDQGFVIGSGTRGSPKPLTDRFFDKGYFGGTGPMRQSLIHDAPQHFRRTISSPSSRRWLNPGKAAER